jgi:hypothetical protein
MQVVDELSEVRAARARLEGWPSLADKKLSGTSAGGWVEAVTPGKVTFVEQQQQHLLSSVTLN